MQSLRSITNAPCRCCDSRARSSCPNSSVSHTRIKRASWSSYSFDVIPAIGSSEQQARRSQQPARRASSTPSSNHKNSRDTRAILRFRLDSQKSIILSGHFARPRSTSRSRPCHFPDHRLAEHAGRSYLVKRPVMTLLQQPASPLEHKRCSGTCACDSPFAAAT